MSVVIDDGSHAARDLQTSFRELWPRLLSGGWYVFEDLGSQWSEGYDGDGEMGSSFTIAFLPRLFGEVLRPRSIAELHAYEEIIFVRKR